MRRLVTTLGVLLCALGLQIPATAQSSTWHWLNPRPTGAYVSGVSCATGGPCYAVGADGLVLVTHDRGRSWITLPSGRSDDFGYLTCPEATTCYATSGGSILTTSDGARSWTAKQLGKTWYLARLICANDRTCYALGSDGTYDECPLPNCNLHGKENVLVRTTDGGRSWHRLSTGDTPALSGIACPITRTCYLAGASGTVLVTRDAGATWHRLARDFVPPSITLSAVACQSTSQCFVGGDGVLLFTPDAGRSWQRVAPPSGIHFGFTDLTCTNTDGCLALGSSEPGRPPRYQQILLDLSSLQNRPRAAVRGTVAGAQIACSDPHDCHVAGGQYSPSSSTDGGRTWWNRVRGDREDLYRITCPSVQDCLAVGQGRALATSNSGQSWQVRGPVVGDDYGNGSDLLCLDIHLCYATRSFGRILISHDGGYTWQSQRNPLSGTAVEFDGIACPARQVCYTVGNGCRQDPCRPGETAQAVVLKTTDGGNHWQLVLRRQQFSLILRALACPSSQVCYVVGSPGIVMITRDGGLSWRDRGNPAAGTSADLLGISCPATQTCYIVGYGCEASFGCSAGGMAGSILVTTTGGRTWRRVTPPLPANSPAQLCVALGCPGGLSLTAITCVSALHCWVVGAEGSILRTADGGASWQRNDSGTDMSLRGIACPARNRCYVVGQGGTVLGLG